MIGLFRRNKEICLLAACTVFPHFFFEFTKAKIYVVVSFLARACKSLCIRACAYTEEHILLFSIPHGRERGEGEKEGDRGGGGTLALRPFLGSCELHTSSVACVWMALGRVDCRCSCPIRSHRESEQKRWGRGEEEIRLFSVPFKCACRVRPNSAACTQGIDVSRILIGAV